MRELVFTCLTLLEIVGGITFNALYNQTNNFIWLILMIFVIVLTIATTILVSIHLTKKYNL